MEESSYEMLYTGTYIIIFIVAISLAVTMYLTVNRYADLAFNYGRPSSVINVGTTGKEEEEKNKLKIKANEVVSYYFNYIKRDVYGGNQNVNSDIIYNVTIALKNGIILNNNPLNKVNVNGIDIPSDSLSYNQVYKLIDTTKDYVLMYEDVKFEDINNNKKLVKITITD